MPGKAQVADLVRTVIDQRNARLVTPPAGRPAATSALPASVSGLRLSAALRGAEATTAKGLGVRRERLAAAGVRYTAASTTVSVSSIKRTGTGAVATVREHSRFAYRRIDAGTPPAMEQVVVRRVRLTLVDGAWQVSAIRRTTGGPVPENDPAPGDTVPAGPVVRDAPPAASQLKVVGAGAAPAPGAATAIIGPSTAALNYTRMRDYAYRYWSSYNGDYKAYGNDCTNFISQAMAAGGWTEVSGFYQSTSAWWYNHIIGNPTSLENASWSWTSVGHWYSFATSTGRTTILSSTGSLGLADVLQMDFTNDGTKDHTMLVTATDATNKYLTYHTTNTKDRSLSSIRAAYPSARFLPHRT